MAVEQDVSGCSYHMLSCDIPGELPTSTRYLSMEKEAYLRHSNNNKISPHYKPSLKSAEQMECTD